MKRRFAILQKRRYWRGAFEKMLYAKQNITLIRPHLLENSEEYECIFIKGVSFYEKSSLSLAEDGFTAGKTIKIRIPAENMPAGCIPQIGDYIAKGELPFLAKLSDLGGITHCKAIAVSDNRRGNLSHWAVIGA